MSKDAVIWARELFGREATTFKQLELNDRFRFPTGGDYRKVSNTGWFHDNHSNKRFRTGVNTAVIKLPRKDTK